MKRPARWPGHFDVRLDTHIVSPSPRRGNGACVDDPNDPENWIRFQRQIAAFAATKEIIEGPALRVPESYMRRMVAEHYECLPEEVTPRQMMDATTRLGDTYRRIEVLPTLSIVSDVTLKSPDPIPALIMHRAQLLAEYKAATKTESDRKIYEAKNAGIHKPEFYKWRKGTLSADSETAKNFERFLRDKKPPMKW
jgi:hypothetical protein